jgi:hypothetical protein
MKMILAALFCLTGLAFSANPEYSVCSWDRFRFETPVAFSAPQKLGLDAVVFIHPADAAPGKGRLEISLASFPKDMVEGLGLGDKELLEYFKTTFLGAGPGQKTVERSFLGKPVKGDAQKTTIPAAKRLETYLIPLPDGARLGLAISASAQASDAEMEKTIARIAQTLKLTE